MAASFDTHFHLTRKLGAAVVGITCPAAAISVNATTCIALAGDCAP